MEKQDKLFEEGNVSGLPFSFNQEVTEVFEDMIDRSVPGYTTSLNIIQQQTKKHFIEQTTIYDLGCSLGASTTALLNAVHENFKIIAIDSSESMIKACQNRFKKQMQADQVHFLNEDVLDSEINNASVVVINFVLQFIKITDRSKLFRKIHKGLVPGGILILSEKVHFNSQRQTKEVSDIYHSFKHTNGYSELEISSKRDSLEGVLITETEDKHLARAKDSGFKNPEKLMSNLNFLTYKFEKK